MVMASSAAISHYNTTPTRKFRWITLQAQKVNFCDRHHMTKGSLPPMIDGGYRPNSPLFGCSPGAPVENLRLGLSLTK
jgi:hypothetical protein